MSPDDVEWNPGKSTMHSEAGGAFVGISKAFQSSSMCLCVEEYAAVQGACVENSMTVSGLCMCSCVEECAAVQGWRTGGCAGRTGGCAGRTGGWEERCQIEGKAKILI